MFTQVRVSDDEGNVERFYFEGDALDADAERDVIEFIRGREEGIAGVPVTAADIADHYELRISRVKRHARGAISLDGM